MDISRTLTILHHWGEALNEEKFSLVTAMYSQNASLLPTFSNKACRTPEDIAEYFHHVSNNDQVRVTYDEASIQIDELGSTRHLATGIYQWDIDNNGASKSVQARFSFVIGDDDSAPILHQHSSVVPE